MDLSFTDDQVAVRDTIAKLCEKYDDAYWLARDTDGKFPEDFVKDLADGGWLGIAMPEEYGGSGLGVIEASLMMQTIAETGAGFSGCSAVHINIFGPNPIVVHGTDEQKERLLPPLIAGKDRTCFGVTEPNAGLDTTRIETKAVWDGEKYIVNGRKMWTSTAQTANKILLLARTAAREDSAKPMDGITMFYTDFDRDYCEAQVIEKMGRKAVDSNATFYDNLPVPETDRIGEEGKGFYYLIDGINPERILVAAEAVGLGRAALRKAVDYAKERVVFDRPIGQNQAIQHPLAAAWAHLEAADAVVWKAAALYDAGKPCGAEANAAKYLAAEACFTACETAVMTHGGMGYAKEFHVERYMREAFIARIAPVSREMILNFIGQHVLDMPRSY
ncbi:MAG: acyl-CoA dehydrogenase family protein [Alphaproteobacteria bacterium]|jgi:acyl-CoA dehydrogenase|nr:acyl-CoA dehydrogenase [Rhodospirillaceae bacterium]MDP6022576.1 acyl-CoA dehydrogenase family protein [Alphaproteobacteria bacterium]MBV41226.1 acyl-CoA dehydrogenase [Rhodospirillaceae bacterium]MDP6255073.1 acyl-CoA dehydrogenase family protein [Alphaproteobacteria bacterium]MDP7230247.1 acyl-CoA dehydrogenase family protein [Alphaproteobacteria bacterium]|tara:strand:- start:1539 stop:2705 length:1167 start_codon:yes stop_codon:yes gene_type:complete